VSRDRGELEAAAAMAVLVVNSSFLALHCSIFFLRCCDDDDEEQ
jgi:hypothetical protein